MIDEQTRELEDEEYEELRPELSRGRKIAVIALGVMIVVVLFGSLVSFWAYRQLFPSGHVGSELVIDIPSGS